MPVPMTRTKTRGLTLLALPRRRHDSAPGAMRPTTSCRSGVDKRCRGCSLQYTRLPPWRHGAERPARVSIRDRRGMPKVHISPSARHGRPSRQERLSCHARRVCHPSHHSSFRAAPSSAPAWRRRPFRTWVGHQRWRPGRMLPPTQRPGAPGCSRPSMQLRPAAPADPASSEIDDLLDYQSRRGDETAATWRRWGSRPAVIPWVELGLELGDEFGLSGPRDSRAQALLRTALYDTVLATLDAQGGLPAGGARRGRSASDGDGGRGDRGVVLPVAPRRGGRGREHRTHLPLPGRGGGPLRGAGGGGRRIPPLGRRQLPQRRRSRSRPRASGGRAGRGPRQRRWLRCHLGRQRPA